MNGIDDIMLYDKTCPFCDGSGEPDEYDDNFGCNRFERR